MPKKIVYVDMDDVLCEFSMAHAHALKVNPDIKYPQCQFDFFRKLVPTEGAKEAIHSLIFCDEYDPYILTAPSTINPMCYTEKRLWVEDHLGMFMVNRLIISPDKSLLKGDILIDDNATGKGQDKFEGRFIHFGSRQYPNWQTIMKELF